MTCDHGGSTGWTLDRDGYNDEYHYYYCTICGTGKSESHVLDAYGNCNICPYSDKSKCQHPNVAGNLTRTNSGDNATHTVTCKNCGKTWPESHTFNNKGSCECGYQCKHPAKDYEPHSNNNGTHSITCGKCGATVKEAATCVDDRNPKGICDICGGPMV